MVIIARRHRLLAECYYGTCTASFTLCLQHRIEYFTSRERSDPLIEMLLRAAREHSCGILVYLFMPDHCHILLQGKNDYARPLKMIRTFKQLSGFWFSRHDPKIRWQKGFYDHILRSDDDVRRNVRYILEHPCRKGIEKDWRKYPLKGSTVYEFGEW